MRSRARYGVLAAVALLGACGEDAPFRYRLFTGVAAGDGRFVAVGTDVEDGTVDEPSVIATSSDGDTWQVVDVPEAQHLESVAFGNGRWVAVGGLYGYGNDFDTTTALVSDDGVAWRAPAAPPSRVYLGTVFFESDRFVAMAADGSGRLFATPDGDTWTELGEAPPSQRSLVPVGGLYLAGGSGLWESPDLATWTEVASTGALHGAVVADGGVVAMTSWPEDEGGFDGWSVLARGTDATWRDVATVPGRRLLAVTGDHVLATDPDQGGLFRTENGPPDAWAWQHVSDHGTAAAAADGAGTVVAAGFQLVASHDDGLTWTEVLADLRPEP